jgi:hypothetical protein
LFVIFPVRWKRVPSLQFLDIFTAAHLEIWDIHFEQKSKPLTARARRTQGRQNKNDSGLKPKPDLVYGSLRALRGSQVLVFIGLRSRLLKNNFSLK